MGPDPVGSGVIASLARPGGNVTGLSIQATDLASKRLELLRELLPRLRRNVVIAFFCCWPSRIAMSGVSNVSRRTRAFRSDACGLVKISVAEAPFAQVRRSQIRAGSVFTMRLQAARIS
jgi:hypothetical protein